MDLGKKDILLNNNRYKNEPEIVNKENTINLDKKTVSHNNILNNDDIFTIDKLCKFNKQNSNL